jgi:hypothetical protein
MNLEGLVLIVGVLVFILVCVAGRVAVIELRLKEARSRLERERREEAD